MALPVGVTTATITFGVPVSFTGGAVRSTVSIVPSASLVHTATGTPLVNFIEDVITSEGVSGQFTLPHTDQLGFQDESGNSYQNWYYTATISYSAGKTTLPPRTKTFQLPTGQTTIDLDLLPAGAPVLPWTAPVATVTSFGGRTNAVTLQESDLPTRLSDASLNATYASVVNVKKYGAVGDGVADDTTAIAAAVTAVASAAALGFKSNLYLPPGKYKVTRLVVTGVSGFTISGEGELIGQDPVNTAGVIRLIDCSKFSVRGVKVSHANATVRNAIGHGIYTTGCSDFEIEQVESSGVSAAGIFVGGGIRFKITKSHVHDTLADGIHITAGSTGGQVFHNYTADTGDDAIAVVSYVADGTPCAGIAIDNNMIYRSHSRGITVVGDDITVGGNQVTDTRAAGIYVARENSYNTYGCHRVDVLGNTVNNANNYASPTDNYGSIHVSSDSASYPIEDVKLIGNTLNGGRRQSILVLGFAADSVKRIYTVGGNFLSGNLNAEGILYQQVKDGAILSNVSMLARTTGIFVDNTSSTIMVNANTVVYPNQANVGTSYAIANQSTNGSTGLNFPRADATKASLLEAVNATNTAGQLQAKANFEAIQLSAVASGRSLLMTGGSAIAVFRNDGQLAWATGGNAGSDAIDVTLSRTAAKTLSMGADNVFRTGRFTTAARPSAVTVGAGALIYDTTLSMHISSDGTVWRDAAGAVV